MKKVAIFMSDFHLGQKDQMEEFHADDEFAELIGRLSMQYAEHQVDLVLLGDVMDLWTTITDDKEVTAQKATDVRLYFPVPAGDQNAMKEAVLSELESAQKIMEAHPLFFETLGRFLARDLKKRRVLYVPGNHDHSMVEQTLQGAVRDKILAGAKHVLELKEAGAAHDQIADQILFPNFYEDKTLQVYAEHGNQFTYKGVFKYDEFGRFGEECPGYYELKLVWNRLERRAPESDNVFMGAYRPAQLPGIFWWLIWKPLLLRRLRRYQIQYEHDKRVEFFRKRMPKPFAAFWHVVKPQWSVTKDEFSDQLFGLFDKESKGIRPVSADPNDPATWWLNPKEIKTIILGHSHQAKDVDLPGLDGVKYYNTGSWIFHCENGRRFVEQTWVTISAEVGGEDGGYDGQRRIIDREMVHRSVELSKSDLSPVTTDGMPLTPEMRKMPGLRVGDVVLFHWNFGVTVRRLLRPFGIIELLFQTLPDIAKSWFNRYGTGSYWNHIALVYGSPWEKKENETYNDPLFLEAIPESGVTINGPKHYLTYRREWDIAVLQPKAKWLNPWENRRLLRRLALGTLQTHYDTRGVRKITMSYAAKTMDVRGRVIVGSLVKGALAGVSFTAVLLLWIFAVKVSEGYVNNKSLSGLVSAVWKGCQDFAATVEEILNLWSFLPFGWVPTEVLRSSPGWIPWVVAGVLDVIYYGFFVVLAVALFWVAARIIVAGSAFSGAGWGVLIGPPLAELCGGWKGLSTPTRWAIAGVWLAIPVIAIEAGFHASENESYRGAMGVERFGFIILLLATIIAWVTTGLARFVEKKIAPLWQWRGEQLRRLRQGRWPNFGKNQPREEQFICSGLVQHALLRAADQVPSAMRSEVDVTPPGEITLPRHFAESPNFKWTYLLMGGEVIPNPCFSYRAKVSSNPCEEESWELNGSAKWAIRFAYLSLSLIVFVDLLRIQHASGWQLRDWVGLGIGVMLGLTALRYARVADRELAIDPYAYRGACVTGWAKFLALAALTGAVILIVGPFFGASSVLVSYLGVIVIVALIGRFYILI
jgi:UDP-2,3-diacylglucosamine pyrophosphatase LpxH